MLDARLRCFHCGESLPDDPPTATVDGVLCPVCCEGCAAAAQWIRNAGLDDYYRLRSEDAPRVDARQDDYAAWMHPDVLAGHSRAVEGGSELTVLCAQMRCAACAWLIDRALMQHRGVLEVSANAVTGRVRIRWDPGRVALPRLLQQLAMLGFAPHLATGAAREAATRKARRTDLLRLGVAGLGAMQAMMFAEALFLDVGAQMPLATRDFLRWITFLVSTPVVFFAGWPFIAGLARELRARHPGMDTLVGGSILLAYGASLVETLRGGPHVWFDAAVMFVLLLLLARQLESWARRRASARVDMLARALPALVWREQADGGRAQVALAALRNDDVVQVAAGEALPADGELLDAAASIDESLLSGEATPVTRLPGETVLAGSVCRESPLRMRVTHAGHDTRLSHLVRLVEQAQGARPKLARIADRVASVFVYVLITIAAFVAGVWMVVEPARAFEVTLAVLVVSCPCALSLAIPAALATAYGRLAQIGVLTLRPDALQTLAGVDTVLMDKTGTLTRGQPSIVDSRCFSGMQPQRARSIAAALQRDSGHVLARAFECRGPGLLADAVRTETGRGVQGRVDGVVYRLGRADFAAARDDDGAIWLGDGSTAFARFELQDEIRADAALALDHLRRLGITAELSSGDSEASVRQVAQTLHLDTARARQSPQHKLDRAAELQREGHCVAMLGDGINDAPVLAGANVSFALAGGASLAHRAADFVVVGERLQRIPQSIALARRTRSVIRQNLAWALAYNLLALPFAALGWVPPWMAALGMALSSLLVTLNALRLMRASA